MKLAPDNPNSWIYRGARLLRFLGVVSAVAAFVALIASFDDWIYLAALSAGLLITAWQIDDWKPF